MRNKIFILSLFISNLNYILYNTLGINNIIKNGIRMGSICLLIFSTILNKKSISFVKVDLIWIFGLLFSLFSLSISNNMINFIYIILVLIASRNVDKEYFIKYNYYIMLISVFVVVAFLFSGLINNVQYTVGGRTRNTFGFLNVNAFSILVYSFFIMHFLYKKKIGIILISIIISSMYFLFRYTDTRTTFISFLIYLFFYIVLKKIFVSNFIINERILKVSLVFIILIPIIFSFLSPILLDKYPYLNNLTSNRLSIFTKYLNENNLINYFFGGSRVRDVDNGYLVILFNTGIIFSFFLLYLVLKALYYFIEDKDYKNISLIISFMYFSAFESIILRPEISISISFWVTIYNLKPLNRRLEKQLIFKDNKEHYINNNENCYYPF